MKNFRLILLNALLLLTVVSCNTYFNNITIYQDEFKSSKKFILNQYFRPEERKSLVSAVNITYEKEIMSVKPDVYNMYFVFTRGTTSFNIDRKGFLKIGESKFDIETKDIQTELKTGVNDTSTTTTDSTGTHTIASSETVHWVNDKFKIALSPDMVAAITQNNVMTIRFYSGPVPVTFNIKEGYYAKMKEMMTRK